VENNLVVQGSEDGLRADVLKAEHHGSKN